MLCYHEKFINHKRFGPIRVLRIVIRSWYNFIVHPFNRIKPKASGKRVLCFGDSNTWGYIPGTGLRFRSMNRWPGVLQRELGNKFCVIEEGRNGRTTMVDDPNCRGLNGKSSLLSCLRSHGPLDIVIIFLGTNDLKAVFNRTAKQIAEAIEILGQFTLETHSRLHGQPTMLLLIAPPPIKELECQSKRFLGGAVKSDSLGDLYEKAAQKLQCQFLDSKKIIQTSPIDGVHLGAEEHRKLGIAVAQLIRTILENS